jgi:hypothetical protein
MLDFFRSAQQCTIAKSFCPVLSRLKGGGAGGGGGVALLAGGPRGSLIFDRGILIQKALARSFAIRRSAVSNGVRS